MKFKKIIRNSLKTLIILFVAVFAYFVYLAIWTNYRRKGLTDTIAEFSGITMQCISSLLFSRQRQSAPTTAVLPSRQHQSVRRSTVDLVDNANRCGEASSTQSAARIGTEKPCRLSRRHKSGRIGTFPTGDRQNRDGFIVSTPKYFPVYSTNGHITLPFGQAHRACLLPLSVHCPRRLSGRHS